MSAMKPSAWAYAEHFVPEPEVVAAARQRSAEGGAVSAGAGAVLRLLTAAVGARHVMEIGTGAGVGSLWLLAGMPEDGVLTTIDRSPEEQRAARAAFAEAGIPHQRTRVITGEALQVLPRMSDGAYDVVVVDADPQSYEAYAAHALRLLRPGGLLVLCGMLGDGLVADPTARDPRTSGLRDLGKALREREDLWTALLPVGDGVLVAVRAS